MTTDLLAEPECRGLVKAGSWPILLDWLEDHGAAVAEVCRLYAGTAPHHTDGMPRRWLARWVQTHIGFREAKSVRRVGKWKWVDGGSKERYFGGPKDGIFQWWAHVIATSDNNTWLYRGYGGGWCPVEYAERASAESSACRALDLKGRAIREVKRKVLSLPWCADASIDARVMPVPPWLADFAWRYWYARDLVGPEKER